MPTSLRYNFTIESEFVIILFCITQSIANKRIYILYNYIYIYIKAINNSFLATNSILNYNTSLECCVDLHQLCDAKLCS